MGRGLLSLSSALRVCLPGVLFQHLESDREIIKPLRQRYLENVPCVFVGGIRGGKPSSFYQKLIEAYGDFKRNVERRLRWFHAQ